MAALTGINDLFDRLTGNNSGTPETVFINKIPRVAGAVASTPAVGRPLSLWQFDGFPAGGATPTAGEIPTLSTTGAIPFTAAGGGREKWPISLAAFTVNGGTFILYDRLYQIGGLNGTLTTDQTVQGSTPSPALTRNTGGIGNFVFWEIYTAIGATATEITMTYTNQAGTTGKTSQIFIGSSTAQLAQRIQRFPLATGDTGVQAVEKVKLTASTGTAGNFGITIGRPLAFLHINVTGAAGWRDITTGLPFTPIDNNACLALLMIPNASTIPDLTMGMTFVEK